MLKLQTKFKLVYPLLFLLLKNLSLTSVKTNVVTALFLYPLLKEKKEVDFMINCVNLGLLCYVVLNNRV